jgi:hypothetical protein
MLAAHIHVRMRRVSRSLARSAAGLFAVLSAGTRHFPTRPPSRRKKRAAASAAAAAGKRPQQEQQQPGDAEQPPPATADAEVVDVGSSHPSVKDQAPAVAAVEPGPVLPVYVRATGQHGAPAGPG